LSVSEGAISLKIEWIQRDLRAEKSVIFAPLITSDVRDIAGIHRRWPTAMYESSGGFAPMIERYITHAEPDTTIFHDYRHLECQRRVLGGPYGESRSEIFEGAGGKCRDT
jgi:hypothetical protein